MLLRPMRLRDAAAWSEVRLRNEAWLAPWESTPAGLPPYADRHSPADFVAVHRRSRRAVRDGTTLPFGICLDGALVGQLTVGNAVRGAFDSAYLGYWVDAAVAGRGIAPTAVALAVDHCLRVGLHRLEANVRPENVPSRRVVEKLGFRVEGLHERYLRIDGAWRDHVAYAVTVEDVVPDGMLARWRATRPTGRPGAAGSG